MVVLMLGLSSRVASSVGLMMLLCACQDLARGPSIDSGTEPALQDASDADAFDAAPDLDALAPLPDAGAPDAASVQAPIPAERAALCARPADDAVRDIFCKGERPTVSSLRELEARLGLDVLPVDMSESEAAAVRVDPLKESKSAVLLGHSTALSGQLVSS